MASQGLLSRGNAGQVAKLLYLISQPSAEDCAQCSSLDTHLAGLDDSMPTRPTCHTRSEVCGRTSVAHTLCRIMSLRSLSVGIGKYLLYIP